MEELRKYLEKLNIEYDDSTINKFQEYMDCILEKNESINLTAIKDRDEFIQKHYMDSISIAGLEGFRNAEGIIDIGTGAGFPGVPLAIIAPEKKFVLVDSLQKRLKIIEELCNKLGIDNVEVIHKRAEEIGRMEEYREQFDFAVSRAVASLQVLSEYCLPLVKIGGKFIAYKGPEAQNEIRDASNSIKTLGGEFEKIEEKSYGGLNHNLVIINKKSNTPKKYPRKPGTPSKQPL